LRLTTSIKRYDDDDDDGQHRTAPNHTGPHRARTGPEMTDYFTSTTVTSRIKGRSRRISPPWFRIRVRDRVRDRGGEILRERQ